MTLRAQLSEAKEVKERLQLELDDINTKGTQSYSLQTRHVSDLFVVKLEIGLLRCRTTLVVKK